MLIKVKKNQETKDMICGGCFHGWDDHDITANTNKKHLDGKCNLCGCTGISDG